MRSNAGLIALAAFAVVLIIAGELARPYDVDWSLSFSRHDKTPHGGYVMHHFLPEVFPERRVTVGYRNVVSEILDGPTEGVTFMIIDDHLHFDDHAVAWIVEDAETGISFFLSALDISGSLADTLGFETGHAGFFPYGLSVHGARDSLRFAKPAAGMPAGYGFEGSVGSRYFSRIDTARTVVLAYDARDRPVFVRVDHGAGHLFLNLTPLAFTNFYLLNNTTAQFAFEALAYLPDQDVHWNEYHKPAYRRAQTPLRFVLRTEPLRWAYYSGLAFVALFIGFHVRRRQRVVPILPEKKNVTLEFTRTIGRLYESHRSHRSAAEKRIAFFLSYLRSHLQVSTETLDEQLAAIVADRSGVAPDTVRQLFDRVESLRRSGTITARDLMTLNGLLEDFYENAKR